jgi:hypothetical protein
MSHKRRVGIAVAALVLLVFCAVGRAGTEPDEIKCLPEQPAYDSPKGDDFSPKAGIHRNQVLVEVATATN